MTDFPTLLARSRAMYESGEEDARTAIAKGKRLNGWRILGAYPKHEAASYLLGAANARRSLVMVRGLGRDGHSTNPKKVAERLARRAHRTDRHPPRVTSSLAPPRGTR